MLAFLCEKYPHTKKHVVFADTGWEHKGAEDWCRNIVSMFGLPLNVCRNKNKTFLTMVEKRGKFPSPKQRQCTSDLKRDPIEIWTRRNTTDFIIVNCMGLRSAESPSRKKRKALSRNNRATNSKRVVWDWLPIKEWTDEDVFSYLIKKAIPLHPVYSFLRRFSCRVCIYMTNEDLLQVKKHDEEAIKIISALEEKTKFTMKPGYSLKELLNL